MMLLKRHFGTVKIFYGNQCRDNLLQGVRLVKKAAITTLGPFGRNVALEYEDKLPRITKDGVTVAQNVIGKNRKEDLGAYLVRLSSATTNKFAGDGTTSSILIASSIFEQAQKYIKAGYNPIQLQRGISKAKKSIVDFLEEIAMPVETDENLLNSAMVSSNYDRQIAECVSSVIKEIGVDGLVTIEPGGQETSIHISNGARITRGYMNEQFAEKGKTSCELNHPYVMVCKKPITEIKDIVPVLELMQQSQSELFIIASEISDQVLSSLVFNHVKGIIKICAITTPGFGNYTEDILEDFSILTGATAIENMNNITLQQLGKLLILIVSKGKAIKVEVNMEETTIIGGQGDDFDVNERIEAIQTQIGTEKSEQKQQILKDRLTRLQGKIAIAYIGGKSESEMNENRDKLIDSLNATKNTMKYGMLPGGGTALAHASKLLDTLPYETEEERYGIQILKDSLRQPIILLARNAGLNGEIILKNVLSSDNYSYGYDLKSNTYGNVISSGVIDSFTVVKSVVDDGVSLGSMLVSIEVAIVQDLNYRRIINIFMKKFLATDLKHYRKEMF